MKVEVQAVRPGDLTEPLGELFIKLWIGYFKEEFYAHVRTHLEEVESDYAFGLTADEVLPPYADALVAVAQEHFAFFSAAEELAAVGERGEASDHEGERLSGAEVAAEDYGASGSQRLAQRMDILEALMKDVSMAVSRMAVSSQPSQAAPTVPPKAMQAKSKPIPKRPPALRQQYPMLDGGVVEAALQAGIAHAALSECRSC